MRTVIDLTGKIFGRLTVLKRTMNNGKRPKWSCICNCGKEVAVLGESLRSGNTSSCGCFHREQLAENNRINNTTHGLTHTRLYRTWSGMKRRCYKIDDKDFCRYGERGITICKEWLYDFRAFYDWAMANGYKENLTIDRINNAGDYEPDNCKWATVKMQNNNRRTNHLIAFNGKTQNIKQWADEVGINRVTLSDRINKWGWNLEKALAK